MKQEEDKISTITTPGRLTSKQAGNFDDFSYGELSGHFSHKLRNSLAVISTAANQISESNRAIMDSDDRELLDAVITASDQIDDTINRFMELVNPYKNSWEKIDLNELCRAGINRAKEPPDLSSLNSTLDFQEAALELEAEPNMIRTLLHNLITNALQNMSKHDRLRITTKKEADQAVITIENSGRKISQKMLPSIFMPFFTTQPGKLGLGLSIAARLIAEHKGTIAVEIEEPTNRLDAAQEWGTVKFTVTLPLKIMSEKD